MPAYSINKMKLLVFISLFLTLSNAIYSQDKNYNDEFGFRSDNDSYLALGQDRYYTNGLFISFRHALKRDTTEKKTAKKIWEIEAGHYIFNPFTGSITNLQDVDRPFAAVLYAGGKFNWLFKNESNFELGLDIGTIGPNAFGREIQEGLHKAIGFYAIKGWEYQVNNEVGINSSFKYTRLIARKQKDNDLSLNTYANIGSTFSGAGAGVLFRAGRINQFFKSVTNNSRISNLPGDPIPEKEIFFFTRPMLHFVAYDATIQGGMFREDKGPVVFAPNRFQYSQEFGVNYAANRWTLNFSITFKSRDVKTQNAAHKYGSAVIYYRF